MKLVLKLLLLLGLLVSFVSAEIDERQIDLYFANGMFGDPEEEEKNRWDDYVKVLKKSNPNMNQAATPKIAYNSHTLWGADDVVEVMFQKLIGDTISWAKTQNYLQAYIIENEIIEAINLLSQSFNSVDLARHRIAYKDSINKGHGIIIVAHSQGNFFTNKAYEYLAPWQKNYFHMIGVASPSAVVSGGGERVSFDNDLVPFISLAPWTIENKNKNRGLDPLTGTYIDYPTLAYHEFKYYMGAEVKVTDMGVTKKVSTDQAKKKITSAILSAITKHNKTLSQYKPKQSKSCATTYCKDKSIAVTHKYDSARMDKHMGNALVYPFNTTKGKLYKVGAKYVLASLGAETIVDNPRDGVCYEITETQEHIDGSKKDTNSSGNGNSFTVHEGIIETTIAWNYELDIDMDLDMSGPNVVHDVKDIPDVGLEHAYVKDHFDVKPGDIFQLKATGKKLASSQLEEECLDTEPVSIYAIVQTPGGSRFKQYLVQNFSELNLKKIAEIEVKEKIFPKWICPGLSGASGWHNLYNNFTNSFQCIQCSAPYSVVWSENSKSYFCNKPVINQVYNGYIRTYQDSCGDNEKKSTCGCVPCEYIVRGMENAVEFGPIAGASVKIVSAQNYGDDNASIIYRGTTTSNADILKAGLIELSSSDKTKFDDESYYVISARGGEDLDRDDDLVRDDIPTPNEGTIHAIIKGSDIKLLSFRLNVLTEAIFQVSGGVLGSNYDAVALAEKLDDGAKKLIKEKLYPTDSDMSIVYRDILLWAPGVDKRVLYKPYDIFVEPIVEKTYSDSPRFDESYALIYEPFISNAPLLSPLSLEIPQGLPNNTAIAKVVVSNDKSFVDVEIKGSYSDYFNMSSDGTLSIAKREAIHTGDRYLFKMRAIDSTGNSAGWVGLNIQVGDGLTLDNPSATVPQMVSIETFDIVENSPQGTVVANAIFKDTNQTIVEYKLTEDDKNSFSVDSNGVITVSANAKIDYETSKLYTFSIIAKNDAGNESYPISVSINILNEIDTPLYPLVFFKHVEENTALGTELGTLDLLRAGLSTIDKFEILSPNIPFEISKEGVVSISEYLDYEQKKSYRFIAIAKSQHGDSNKIECQIVIDDQDPELGIPSLKDLTISVDENVLPGTKIGQLELDQGATDIIRIALYGENDNFRVDTTGAIYMVSSAKLDYENKSRYDLGARALNSRGYGNEVHIVVEVSNVLDEVAILEPFKSTIEENLQADTVIGSIKVLSSGEGDINSFNLTGDGSQNFIIDTNGTIRVSSSADLDYEKQTSYVFLVSASGSAGESLAVNMSIFLTNLVEKVAVIKDFSANVAEDIAAQSIVGQIEVIEQGASPIDSYKLLGYGAESFSIDNRGVIKLANIQLDFETKNLYILKAKASTQYGDSNETSVTIEIIDVDEYAEAGLGRWGDASIKIYKLEDNATQTLKFSETTSVGADVNTTGLFDSHRLELEQNSFYLYEVSGGEDYDANNDGVIDASPTPNSGTIHAVVKGSWVRHINWRPRVNLMSEVYYQWVKSEIDNFNVYSLERKLLYPNQSRYFYLHINNDLNGDDTYGNAVDALIYNPIKNIGAWNPSYFPQRSLEYLRTKIYENNPVYALFIVNSFINPSYIYNADVTLSADESKIFSVDDYKGLRLIDISDLNAPTVTNIMQGKMELVTISSDNKYLFIKSKGVKEHLLKIVDISDILNPVEVSKTSIPDFRSMQLSKDETKLYVTFSNNHNNGLRVIDISNIAQPVVGTHITTPGQALNLVLSQDEHTAYMTDTRGGLQIIDVSDSNEFKLLSTYNTKGLVEKVLLSSDGTKAYLAIKYPTDSRYTQKGYLHVVDITDKNNPSLFVEHDLNTTRVSAFTFNADETKMFINTDKTRIYEKIGDFQEMRLLGEIADNNCCVDKLFLIQNETILLSISMYKIKIIDISDPANPIIIKTIRLKGMPS